MRGQDTNLRLAVISQGVNQLRSHFEERSFRFDDRKGLELGNLFYRKHLRILEKRVLLRRGSLPGKLFYALRNKLTRWLTQNVESFSLGLYAHKPLLQRLLRRALS